MMDFGTPEEIRTMAVQMSKGEIPLLNKQQQILVLRNIARIISVTEKLEAVARREWVDLTDEEIEYCFESAWSYNGFANELMTKLREKNDASYIPS